MYEPYVLTAGLSLIVALVKYHKDNGNGKYVRRDVCHEHQRYINSRFDNVEAISIRVEKKVEIIEKDIKTLLISSNK